MKSDLVDLKVVLHHETEKAWLVSIDGENKVWIPKSRAEFEPDKGPWRGTLTLSEALAIEKGLV